MTNTNTNTKEMDSQRTHIKWRQGDGVEKLQLFPRRQRGPGALERNVDRPVAQHDLRANRQAFLAKGIALQRKGEMRGGSERI